MTVATLFVATRTRPRGREGGDGEGGGKEGGERKTHHRTRASSSPSSSSFRSKKTKGSSVVKNTTGKRPLQVAHLDTDADRNAVRIASKTPAIPVKTKEYAFDAVFDAQSTNEQVYRNVFLRSGKSSEDANVVETILRGGIATVFAYGATGSGKTHTMIGRKEDPGMMMRSIHDVFDGVERMNEKRKTRRGERSREEGGEVIGSGLSSELGGEDVKRLMSGGAKIGDLAQELEL